MRSYYYFINDGRPDLPVNFEESDEDMYAGFIFELIRGGVKCHV